MNLYCFYSKSHKILLDKFLKPSAIHDYNILAKECKQICQTGNYTEKGWTETQREKVKWWIESIKNNLGKIIVCSDVDVQLFEGSKKFLLQKIKNYDILFQKNNETGFDVCSGFFICKCSEEIISFMELVLLHLKNKKSGSGEQVEINKILCNYSAIKIKWNYLDRDKIWNPGGKYKFLEDLKIPKKLLLHHANWCVGVEEKIKQLDFVKNKVSSINLNKFSPQSPKIIICLSSLLRNFEFASISLIIRVILSLPSKPDCIGHFPLSCKTYKNVKTLKKLEKYCNSFVIKFEEDPDVSEFNILNRNMAYQVNGIKGNLLHWHSMKSCRSLLKEKVKKNSSHYDWVIWCRPDLHYFNSLENINLLDNNNYYSTSHDNHLNGLNDRFFISNLPNALKRMSIYDYFIKDWHKKYSNNKNHLTWSTYYNKYVWNAEIVLRDYLIDLNLNVSKINLCFGKLRDNLLATKPYWNSIQNEHDIINPEVNTKISKMNSIKPKNGQYLSMVNIFEDSSLFYSYRNSEPIESKIYNSSPCDKSILSWLSKKILNE